jgi:hypothetical protein
MLRGLGAPVLTWQGSGKVEIVPDGLLGSGTLMTSWGSGEAKGVPTGDLTADTLLTPLVGYAYY